jgi:hypothetical protein
MNDITTALTFGALRFCDPRDFVRPLTEREEIQQAMDALALLCKSPLTNPPIADWPSITDCTSHGAGFSLDAKTPAVRVSLRFNPAASPLGDYEIHFLNRHRKETGRVLRVTPVEDKDLHVNQYAALRPFPIRYVVVTCDLHGTKRVWLIGITSVRTADQTELDSN